MTQSQASSILVAYPNPTLLTIRSQAVTNLGMETKKRGFAGMDPTRLREVASKGGKAAHAAGTAYQFTSEKAREAGRKGGNASHRYRGRQVPQGTADENHA